MQNLGELSFSSLDWVGRGYFTAQAPIVSDARFLNYHTPAVFMDNGFVPSQDNFQKNIATFSFPEEKNPHQQLVPSNPNNVGTSFFTLPALQKYSTVDVDTDNEKAKSLLAHYYETSRQLQEEHKKLQSCLIRKRIGSSAQTPLVTYPYTMTSLTPAQFTQSADAREIVVPQEITGVTQEITGASIGAEIIPAENITQISATTSASAIAATSSCPKRRKLVYDMTNEEKTTYRSNSRIAAKRSRIVRKERALLQKLRLSLINDQNTSLKARILQLSSNLSTQKEMVFEFYLIFRVYILYVLTSVLFVIGYRKTYLSVWKPYTY